MCIGGTSIIVQMAILNCCKIYPIREIPRWLRKMQACISCDTKCAHKPRENKVQSYLDDNGHSSKHVREAEDQNIYSTHIESEDAKNDPALLGKNKVLHYKLVNKGVKIDQNKANLQQEWIRLAGHCDRLFFFIFAAIHIFVIFFILVIVPYMHV